MFSIPFFMALRFIRTQTTSSPLSFITKLCFGSIVTSTAALALIAAIMQGFHHATLQTLKGMSPDLVVKSAHDYINAPKIINIIEAEFPQVQTAMPCNMYHVLLQNPEKKQDISHFALMAAVDPTSPLLRERFVGQVDLSKLTNHTIVLGKLLAEDLHVQCGDEIIICYPENTESGDNLSIETAKAHVTGIFNSGVEEWDAHGAFISLNFAHTLFNDENLIQQLQLKVDPNVHLTTLQKSLQKRLRLPVTSWYDMNPALVSALTLEKCAMLSILVLIMLITGITTAALLCMQLTHHTRTIAVLAAYGMSFQTITNIFIVYSILITSLATGIGLSIATVLSYVIDHYQLFSLPTIYYINYVPAHMSWSIILMVTLLSLTISSCAAWYPARKIRYLPLARILADV